MEVSDGSTASYYELPPNATELQHLISHRDMNAQVGEIFRACYRYGMVLHSPKKRDIKKIIFYAQAELERLEKLDAHREVPESRGVPSTGTGTNSQRDPDSEVADVQGEAVGSSAAQGGGDPGIAEYWLRCSKPDGVPVRLAGDVQALPCAEGDSGVHVADQAGVLS
jgi:hypothetical protein